MCTRVTQNTDPACAWACAGAAVLEAILMGQAPSEAVAGTVRELRRGEVSGEAGCRPEYGVGGPLTPLPPPFSHPPHCRTLVPAGSLACGMRQRPWRNPSSPPPLTPGPLRKPHLQPMGRGGGRGWVAGAQR